MYSEKIIPSKLLSESFKHIVEQYGEAVLAYKDKLAEKFRLLERFNTPIWYPETVKIVPTYKFTKFPMVKWSSLQNKPSNDPEVVNIKIFAGKAGKLINSAMVLDRILVVDLDSEKGRESVSYLAKFFDVETRRGFHKIFFLKSGRTALFRFGQARAVGKTQIHLPELNAKLEIKSGPQFLSTYPLQSHYLIIDTKKQDLIIKRYNPVSICAKKIVYANDTTCALASETDIVEYIVTVIENVNTNLAKSIRNNFRIEVKDNVEAINSEVNGNVPKAPTRSLNYYGSLTYEEFKQYLESRYNWLPNCIRTAFFESVEEGYGYAFAILAAKVFPLFVRGTEEEVLKVAKDFASRFRSFKSAKLYYWYYYGFGTKPERDKAGTPSAYDVPDEIYELIFRRANCELCLYNQKCRIFNAVKKGVAEGVSPRFILLSLAREKNE